MALRRATTDDIPAIVALTEAAYLPNEAISGAVSLPRMADYTQVLARHEVWLAEGASGLDGVLVLEQEPERFTIWSIAVSPAAMGARIGSKLMRFAEEQALARGHDAVHLYTNAKLADRVAWYERLGYVVTHYEERADRRLVHMRKPLARTG